MESFNKEGRLGGGSSRLTSGISTGDGGGESSDKGPSGKNWGYF